MGGTLGKVIVLADRKVRALSFLVVLFSSCLVNFVSGNEDTRQNHNASLLDAEFHCLWDINIWRNCEDLKCNMRPRSFIRSGVIGSLHFPLKPMSTRSLQVSRANKKNGTKIPHITLKVWIPHYRTTDTRRGWKLPGATNPSCSG